MIRIIKLKAHNLKKLQSLFPKTLNIKKILKLKRNSNNTKIFF